MSVYQVFPVEYKILPDESYQRVSGKRYMAELGHNELNADIL